MEKKRPIGVTVIAISSIISGCYNFTYFMFRYGSYHIYKYSYFLLWNLITIVIGIGLFRLKELARIAIFVMIATNWIVVVGTEIYFFVTNPRVPSPQFWYMPLPKGLIIEAMINLLVMYYLIRPRVKEQFK